MLCIELRRVGRAEIPGGSVKLTVVIGLGLLSAMAALASSFGSAVAAASGPDFGNFSGQTYAKVAEQITNAGGKPIIATVVGGRFAADDCIISGAQKADFRDSSGRPRGYEVLLDLNCGATLAAPGRPGNSVASPEGRQAQAAVNYINTYPSYCSNSAKTTECQGICQKTGKCNDKVLEVLSAGA